ncbi:hypothetical protein R5R35_011093 [Gryllus longicercus]|uniref:Pyrroline-5-carboxylate reductase n=1 Tax=Gryllus longicercus TaxID=2509291 RepID=A0AAN9VWM9_9ORTH
MADGNEKAIACNIGFIGAGNMAWAIGEGLVKTGAVSSTQIIVSAPTDNNLGRWRQLGSKTSFENGDVIKNSDVIILATKPNKLDEALNDAIRTLPPNEVHSKVFVSILAGVKVDGVHSKVNAVVPKSRVVRVVPNTPVAVGAGASIYCRGPTATTEDLNLVKKIFSCGGICEEVPENLMDSAGALCGCGPAFIYIMIEALADGAVKMGVPRAMATKFAAQTVKGASMMVLETGKHPGLLKDEVCSPGGTTITGVHAMERLGVRSALMDAIEAAAKRSIELGNKY